MNILRAIRQIMLVPYLDERALRLLDNLTDLCDGAGQPLLVVHLGQPVIHQPEGHMTQVMVLQQHCHQDSGDGNMADVLGLALVIMCGVQN